jgi:hypothetical protein
MNPNRSPTSQPAVITFVIRIWQEWSLEGSQWRGLIEYLQTRCKAGFQDLERMQAFLQSFGLFIEEET